ncbi:hypothetical protein [Stygiolobus azoricus]|uniref:Uncharacterized protein n=1 Tax=Stygiolobus azoricus TaxID=41675 RepID=A0A650CM70_9CREN|nr:hypothetical protein [Stygiolobus azoricus]QGR18567.1 hypothetical protein D1868_00185 [Stygiolobus azoricus]
MVEKIILYAFLIQGLVLSYTVSSYISGGGQIFISNYNMTMQWQDLGIGLNITGKEIYYPTPLVKPQVTPFNSQGEELTYYSFLYRDETGGLQFILFFTNFTLTSATVNGTNIPAIKFYNGNSYLVISAQYGFPIKGVAYNYISSLRIQAVDNISINMTGINPLPPLEKSGSLYKLTLKFSPNVKESVYVVTPQAIISAKSLTYKLENKTFSLGAINLESKGYVTVIIPIDDFPIVEPTGTVLVNGSNYFFKMNGSVTPFGTYYQAIPGNTSNPYMGFTIGKYFLLIFPNGGNISIILQNLENPLTSYHVTDLSSPYYPFTEFLQQYWIPLAVVIVLVVLVTVILRYRRG